MPAGTELSLTRQEHQDQSKGPGQMQTGAMGIPGLCISNHPTVGRDSGAQVWCWHTGWLLLLLHLSHSFPVPYRTSPQWNFHLFSFPTSSKASSLHVDTESGNKFLLHLNCSPYGTSPVCPSELPNTVYIILTFITSPGTGSGSYSGLAFLW